MRDRVGRPADWETDAKDCSLAGSSAPRLCGARDACVLRLGSPIQFTLGVGL
jgi:hypothetical protein